MMLRGRALLSCRLVGVGLVGISYRRPVQTSRFMKERRDPMQTTAAAEREAIGCKMLVAGSIGRLGSGEMKAE